MTNQIETIEMPKTLATDPVKRFTNLIEEGVLTRELAGLTHRKFDRPAAWVADWLMRAVDAKILEIRPHEHAGGWALSYEGPLATNVAGDHRALTVYWTFRKADKSRMFAPEAAISVAAAARLVLEFGHPVDTVEVESDGSAVDGVAHDRPGKGGRPILAVEAKVTDVELRALVAGIAQCGGTGHEDTHRAGIKAAGLLSATNVPNHHKKCPYLLRYGPLGFWAVSAGIPDGEVFIARPVGDRFVLERKPFEMLQRDHLIEALAAV